MTYYPTDSGADPVQDLGRLLEVSRYDFEAPEVRAALHRLARRAAECFDLPIGLVSIVLDSALYLAGMHGIDGWMAEAEGTPVEWSFCANAVRSGQPYVVEDATVDAIQADNPLVTIDGIRSYAGAPLVTESGHVLGACCVIGTAPRTFTPDEVRLLVEMAQDAVDEIARHRLQLELM